MTNFINQLMNGLQLGSIYALVALGYTMVYGIVKLINFAHGDIIMVGSYIALSVAMVFATAISPIVVVIVLLCTVILCSLLGVSIEFVAYKPLRNSSRISPLITAIGMSLLLQNLFQLIFGSAPQQFPSQNLVPGGGLIADFGEAGIISISNKTFITVAVSIVLMIILQLIVNHSRMGKAMRAVSEDMGAAQLMGINVNSTISFTFAIGSGLAGIAAILFCIVYPQVNPFMGSMLGLKAFVAAVFGGIGVIPGAMIGGFLIGIFESLTRAYISSQWADAVVFGTLIIVLLFKPAGLFGKNFREKV